MSIEKDIQDVLDWESPRIGRVSAALRQVIEEVRQLEMTRDCRTCTYRHVGISEAKTFLVSCISGAPCTDGDKHSLSEPMQLWMKP